MNRIIFIAVVSMLSLCADLSAGTGKNAIDFRDAELTELSVTVDGQPVKVRWYKGGYLMHPNRPQDQIVNVFVPGNATRKSPIILYVDNAGWLNNHYRSDTVIDGEDYCSTDEYEKVAVALKKGYVVVSYGCRSRGNAPEDGIYKGHSPATMTDTKAVVRYLRYNRKSLPAGDTDRIFVTGISGGGALSTLIAASGNSPDFFDSLHEVGAAGIKMRHNGRLRSKRGCGDDVYGVIAYCPITDLGHACAAYEWLFHDTRMALYQAGEEDYPFADESTIMSASAELSEMYKEYLDGLGLKDRDGNDLNSGNFRAFIESLMVSELERAKTVIGPEAMLAEIEAPKYGGDGSTCENNGWLQFGPDGELQYDFDKHLYYLGKYTPLKPAPAFSNRSLLGAPINEDTLFGSGTEELCPFNEYSWNHDETCNGVGKDDTGLDWDAFMATDAGRRLALQIKMTSAVDYLIEGKSDTAPYWYVRHGMDDRDTSFAVEALLFASIWNCRLVKDSNVRFEYLEDHDGDYDIPEAYGWLESVLGR